MTETPHTWERQPDEPANWFARFLVFRDLGAERTIAEAFRRYTPSKTKSDRKRSVSNAWHSKAEAWQWFERAEAWDDWKRREDRKRELGRQRAIDQEWKHRQLQHRQKMWDMRTRMLTVAEDMLQSSLYTKVIEQDAQGNTVIKLIPARWSFSDIPKFVKLADELGRQATGATVDHLSLLNELRQIGWIDDDASDRIAEELGGAIEYGRKAIALSAAEMIEPEDLEELQEDKPDATLDD